MRWQMTDHIDTFEPWVKLQGRKCVSLEEGYLLKRVGRSGVMPEGLLIESMAQHCRWLAVASSDFSQSALLCEISSLRMDAEARMGDRLEISVEVKERADETFLCSVRARRHEQTIAVGSMRMVLESLTDLSDAEESRLLWRELYGKA